MNINLSSRMKKIDIHIQKSQLPSIIEILWKLILIIFASMGVYLQARDDGGLFSNHTFLYFTIISNMGTAIVFFIFFIVDVFERLKKDTFILKKLFTVKYIFTTAMTVTLIVSACFLAPFKDSTYLFSMKNLSLHIFAPLITVIDFLMFDRQFVCKWKTIFLGFVLPILYLTVTLLLSIKGISYSNGTNYPYYFLDYNSLGWLTFGNGQLGVLWWILIISVIVFITSFLLIALKKFILKIYKK